MTTDEKAREIVVQMAQRWCVENGFDEISQISQAKIMRDVASALRLARDEGAAECYETYVEINTKLMERLAKARLEAIEECANLARDIWDDGLPLAETAERIRALKDQS